MDKKNNAKNPTIMLDFVSLPANEKFESSLISELKSLVFSLQTFSLPKHLTFSEI